MRKLSVLFLSIFLITSVVAQEDTTVVQCFDFDDITKRRGVYEFPDGSESYRRVLMSYRLKCDPRTTRDGYDCGEWDYLTYTFIHDHSGEFDSTRRTHPLYLLSGVNENSYDTRTAPTFDMYQTQLTRNRVTAGSNLTSLNTQNALGQLGLNHGQQSRSQYAYTAAELTAAGLSAGSSIRGIALNVLASGDSIKQFTVKAGWDTKSDYSDNAFVEGLTEVYNYSLLPQSAGVLNLTFNQSLQWDGSSNLIIEFSKSESVGTSADFEVESGLQSIGLRSSAVRDQYLALDGSNQFAELGDYNSLSGAAAKTVECWARVNSFDNGGIFQMGGTGSQSRDFSLRTTTSTNTFRVQLWGTDFNATVSGVQGSWHHYAVTYDGTVARFYVDGQLQASRNVALNTNVIPLRIGRWQGNYLDGDIDNFRVWNKALSASEIQSSSELSDVSAVPFASNKVVDVSFNRTSGPLLLDEQSNAEVGVIYRGGTIRPVYASDYHLDKTALQERPVLSIDNAINPTVASDTTYIMDTIYRTASLLVKYNNPANGVQIPDNSPVHPTIPTDTQVVYPAKNFGYVYQKSTGMAIDSVFFSATIRTVNETKVWYSPYARFEIGRFITPYGIGLDLGNEGFEWVYDVTDYAPLLRDSVDISAGNTQELLDLKFYFIKGTPARDVIGIKRVWGQSGSHRYDALDNDSRLQYTPLYLSDKTEYLKLKTRITGHGHQSSNPNNGYPHCCEWKENEHYLYVNGSKVNTWRIWQDNKCALNPVFPQGGNWPPPREGWCPGDRVGEVDLDLSSYAGRDSINIDYGIEPVPLSNTGMGAGNFIMGMHAIQYSKGNFEVDAEIYDVLHPNAHEYYQRMGFTCQDAEIILRNGGTKNLTSALINYQVGDGVKRCIHWYGNLSFMDTTTVSLPIEAAWFYNNTNEGKFRVWIEEPNDLVDENPANDAFEVPISIPDMYPADYTLIFEFRTNTQPQFNSGYLRDYSGTQFFTYNNLQANQLYRDTMKLGEGCYRWIVDDERNDGLEIFTNPGQGSGYTRIWVLDGNGTIINLKTFENNFGRRFSYEFTVGNSLNNLSLPDSVSPGEDICAQYLGVNNEGEVWQDNLMNLFPNPTTDGVNVELHAMKGNVDITVISMAGSVVHQTSLTMDGGINTQRISTQNWEQGVYLVSAIDEQGFVVQKKLIVN